MPPASPPPGAGAASGGPTRRSAWQMLADAARLGIIRHGRPEAWAAGAVIALARVSGLTGPGRSVSAQQVADEFDVTLGTLAVTERELARALHLARYARRPPSRSEA